MDTKRSRGVFECDAHKLMLLLEDEIKKSEGITKLHQLNRPTILSQGVSVYSLDT